MKMELIDLIDEHVTNLMASLTDLQVPSHREFEFRVSSLPFCPLYQLIKEKQTANYQMEHYTSIGTAMHETIQAWLSLNPEFRKRIWGNWKCTGCAKKKKHQFFPKHECDCKYKQSTDPDFRGYPKFWNYEEITVRWKRLSGHVDLIYFLNNTAAIVIDFKSSALTEKKQSWYYKEDQPGSPSYVAQIRSYGTLLPITHNLPIVGWSLITVDRTKPILGNHSFSPLSSEWGPDKQARWLKLLDSANENYIGYEKLMKHIDNEDSKKAKKQLTSLIASRPCTCKKTYAKFMDYKFFGKDKCPVKAACLKGDDKALQRIEDMLSEKD